VPSYFYECQRCAKVFTEVRKLDEYDEPAIHSECGSMTTKRVILGPFFVRGGEGANSAPSLPSRRNSSPADGSGPWNVTMTNCKAIDCGTGIGLAGNIRVRAYNTELRGNQVSIDLSDNAQLNATNTVIE
jgi:putative FmdB family regulatory protein